MIQDPLLTTDRRHKHSATDCCTEPNGQSAAAFATGLGTSFNESPRAPRLRKPRSFDPDSLTERDPRPICGDLAATAPLPSSGSFKMLSPDASPTKGDTEHEHHQGTLESGRHEAKDCGGRLQSQQQPETGGIAGVLESVNVLIDFVAGQMARMASDRVVDNAERGLLLPVKNEEREPATAAV